MNYLLFGLEVLLIVTGIALVPARSELRICRSRVTYSGRPELKTSRSQRKIVNARSGMDL